ncbi:hypothetical protein [Avibacterium sp. 21-599]|uniref:hypothetical protein n=1 Tax=Avibacterium sp. 21-599 TaxID=2911528 RepID=UPI002247A6E8|nr:hypothetical protein [Avibacterium sp. 21-599]MCW9717632.1 hypothetical protein [Avibacterium sp. 21-599]
MAFEQFPQYPKTSPETNARGIQNCHQILGCQDTAVRAFNQLAQDAKRSVCLLGKVTKADLASSMALGDRWEHYSKAGQIKLVQGMIELHNAINAIPTKAMLVEYRKVLWRSE